MGNFLSGRNVEAQAGHNDFEHDRDKSAGFFDIITGSFTAFVYVYPGSHYCVFYTNDERPTLTKILRIEEVTIPSDSEFIGHGYFQHAGGEWPGM